LKIIPLTRFRDRKTAMLTLKMRKGSHLWFCKIISEAACNKLIFARFSCSQWEVGTREHRTFTEKGFWGGFQKAFSNLVSAFKEAINNFIIVYGSERCRKTLKTSAHTREVLIKMFRASKKLPSRNTVPLTRLGLQMADYFTLLKKDSIQFLGITVLALLTPFFNY
jgi:hypothetical protein